MSVAYESFLKSKALLAAPAGLSSLDPVHPRLFGFQADIVRWALRLGRAALFADCGMGKSCMQLEFARQVPGPVLILCPLAVAEQTVEEAALLDLPVQYCRNQDDIKERIAITNYEMLGKFDPDHFAGVVVDESGILKSFSGAYRTQIIESFRQTPFRLACTATPAPNDHMELGNHAEFLGVMSYQEMLSMFFCHDGGDTSQWRLKGHSEKAFWKWVASWATMIRKPSDLGYPDGSFILPEKTVHNIVVEAGKNGDFLFPIQAASLQERIGARRDSIIERVDACAELVNADTDTWLIWCNLNAEAGALEKAIPGAVQVQGSDNIDFKVKTLRAFARGELRVLISKPSIAGHGLNLQVCHKMAFVGLSDSWEDWYQAVRRCWRFGQKSPVDIYVITAKPEGAVVANIQRKETQAEIMAQELIKNMEHQALIHAQSIGQTKDRYHTHRESGDRWEMYLGDCVDVIKTLPTESVGMSVYSPPFESLYVYSASERDIGNCRDSSEFETHMKFLGAELFRVMKPGRVMAFHCMNLPAFKARHGFIGLRDFRGALIQMFSDIGFIYHSEVCIWKDPVTAMQRTKALGLLWKQVKKDSCMSRQGIADYVVAMRKPGENPSPVSHSADEFPVELWQKWASPVWMDIDPGDTLQFRSVREDKDERHICPLQLEVIRRAIRLWSNPGDTVLSPFAGIGSEGHVAIELDRKFIGVELKQSYFRQAVANLRASVAQGVLIPA